jgi:GcrA cell cycle regulator
MPKLITAWTDDRVAILKSHIEQGYTCAQVANILGGTTRNAVIGIMNRRGIHSPNACGLKKTKKVPRPRKQKISIFATRWGAFDAYTKPPEPVVTTNVVAEPMYVPLARLNNITCRWPYGEAAPYSFCGCATTRAPYCEAHTAQSIGKGTTSERLAAYAPKEAVAA